MSKHRWTLAEIKAENTRTGGKFFSRENMRFAGDTMRNFRVIHDAATGDTYIQRKAPGKPNMPLTRWRFEPSTGRIRSVN